MPQEIVRLHRRVCVPVLASAHRRAATLNPSQESYLVFERTEIPFGK